MELRQVELSDAQWIVDIYNHYIATTAISFEEESVSIEDMKVRIDSVLTAGLPWIVLEEAGQPLGYAYAAKWKPRSAYRYTVEPSIYLSSDAKGKGAGQKLYTALIAQLRELGIKNAIGTIALPNPSSVALHENMGFRKVGEFANIGFKFDQHISVGYWQLELS
ncbi:GNAT family N-acetyltransferase [Vibrio europaeus]|uniref:GNAT family N-acetyltransferase n=1 Tax=Vibrio europaeus TaxID=300876 RepID=UPI00148DA6F1|nr:GNAT family N-acetyltransferase [Vibrio europaeus]NOH22231.1 N-acetyltransferase family protein [Vibrio europaeus]